MAKWLNTKEINFIWHGEWADPELEIDGRFANYWEVEQYCVDCMKDENLDYNNDEIFGKWVCEHEDEIADIIYQLTVTA